ncbi:MAG: FecR family protein [Candidatus Rokuibacteriota bacterium]
MSATKIFAMAVALLGFGLPAIATAQSEESAGVVTTVNGDATLFRAVAAARPVSLRMRDEIFVRDRIHTRERSLVRVLLGGKALITMRELSVLTVTEEAGRVTVDLQSGKVGVAVVKSRMRPGEVIEIRSPNATAAVRGTVFVVEVDPVKAGAATPTTTRVHLFHGALDVSAHLDPAQPTVRLAEMQSVVVAGNVLGAVSPISRDAVAALTADLKPKQMETKDAPDEFKRGLMAREQGRAVMLASALLAPPSAPAGSGQGAPDNGGGTVNGVTGVVGNVTDATELLGELIDTLGIEGVAGGLGGVVGSTVSGLGGTVSGLGSGVSGLGTGVSSLGTGVSSLGTGVSGLGAGVSSLGTGVTGLGGAVGGAVGGGAVPTGGGSGGGGGGLGGLLGLLGGLLEAGR